VRLVILLAALACCVACQSKPKPIASAHDRNQAFLDRVADDCGLPRNTFRLIGDDHVRVQPAANANYKSVDCALGKLLPNKRLKLGFVGNEAYSNEVR